MGVSSKQLFRFAPLALFLFFVIGCAAEDAPVMQEQPPVEKEPAVVPQESTLQKPNVEDLGSPDTLEERFSYTYGYLVMEAAMRDIQEIDPYYFARGALDSGLMHAPLVPSNEMNRVLFKYQDKLISEAARRLEELAQKNLEDAESFLAVNGKREGVITTPSGLQYEVIRQGDGPQPDANDVVRIHYRISYLDGRECDASIKGIPSMFDLSSLIPGFREGLMLMNVGSQFKFYVHPKLGYGETGSTKIEPNTLLIIDVELVEIIKQ